MAKYANKIEKEDGSTIWLANDGKEYKTKAGAWKHSKKLEALEEKPKEEVVEEKQESEVKEEPKWISEDYQDVIEDISEVIPSPLKKIKPRGTGKVSKKQVEAERQINESILKVGYRTSDMMLTRYKRAVLDDEKADKISHSEEDYEWISGVTQDALDYNGISLGAALGPNQIALGANAYWFGSPIIKINHEDKKSPFQGRVGGFFGRIVERLPFIGKRIRERRMATIEEEVLKNE